MNSRTKNIVPSFHSGRGSSDQKGPTEEFGRSCLACSVVECGCFCVVCCFGWCHFFGDQGGGKEWMMAE